MRPHHAPHTNPTNKTTNPKTNSVRFTPTVEHCSMATLIGLCIRTKLLRALPPRFKVDIALTPGSHMSEDAVNKQLNDKERVAAALENGALLAMVDRCLAGGDGGGNGDGGDDDGGGGKRGGDGGDSSDYSDEI
jgi:uncharacterized membrane protein YgcG